MLPLDRRTAFARHSQWLALALEALVLSSLLASAVPLAPAQPVWWLRLSDAAINLAPLLLLAVMVLRLGDALLDSDADEARTSRRRSHQLASRWAFVFALLVPLQVIGREHPWAGIRGQARRGNRAGRWSDQPRSGRRGSAAGGGGGSSPQPAAQFAGEAEGTDGTEQGQGSGHLVERQLVGI